MKNKTTEINGVLYANMLRAGAQVLEHNMEKINALNVFPVPDGDTGTNMNMTFSTGVREVNNAKTTQLSIVSQAIAKGLLMGARGNSGVILSQLFRGFSKSIEGKESITGKEFANALKAGSDTAYKAIMKPVEGTILTVSKDAANVAVEVAQQTDDVVEVMEATLTEAKASLLRTKEILPILKQVGVVDSGGRGLVCVYEGMLAVLRGEDIQVFDTAESEAYFSQDKDNHVQDEVAEMMSEGLLSVEDIHYGYCTEFMILRNTNHVQEYNDHLFREQLSQFGDSLLVVSDDELVKVHIHAEQINEVLYLAQQYGELTRIKIENMREQFRARSASAEPKEKKKIAVIAIGSGEGIRVLFTSLGVDKVVIGGQTMNPSAEDIVKAIKEVHAENVIILPNNSNIILTAEQSASLVEENVVVIPSKTIQQGLAAMFQYEPDAEVKENESRMHRALEMVVSGQVTYAVRDTELEDIEIKEGDFMGIINRKIVISGESIVETTKELIDRMIQENDGEVLTLIRGEDADEQEFEAILRYVEERFEDVEVESHYGGQPVYPYMIAFE